MGGKLGEQEGGKGQRLLSGVHLASSSARRAAPDIVVTRQNVNALLRVDLLQESHRQDAREQASYRPWP